MSHNLIYKTIVIGVLCLFVCVAVVPCFSVVSEGVNEEVINLSGVIENLDVKTVTFYQFDKTGNGESEVVLSNDSYSKFYFMFEELNHMITYYPLSDETEVLKLEFVDLLDNLGLIPEDSSKDDVIGLINPSISRHRSLFSLLPLPIFDERGSAFFCNFATLGEGSQFPVIILPRLIPIIQLPIPRVIMHWNAVDGITSCGGLLSGKGFIAEGAQQGTALGFWGIGFSVFLPPVMGFGFIGYALFATATAEVIHPWPPNRPPVISGENPTDGSISVPVDLSELSFHISDPDGDRMNYTVTTDPYIGSGSGSNVVDGTYTVDVSGLNSNTEYFWHIVVTDGEDITEESFTFRTEIEAPFVSDPLPPDEDIWVSIDLSELSFRLEDLQGNLMDYSVETVPNIGGGSDSNVGDGIYSVDVEGLEYTMEYTWFVNVTDGEYWTRRIFVFKTQPVLVFDPFDEGWQYRKKIVINHSQVVGDLMDFPVLVSLVDSDLASKAQDDGDDILFMDGSGYTNRMFHEIELFDDSSGELVAWVNIPSLSSTEDTVLYLYYGNSGCDSQQYPVKVWDSNYVAVWHMIDSPDSSHIQDSTSYDNEGDKKEANQPREVNSKIGKGQYFDENDYINIPYSSWYPELGGMNEITLEVWVKPDSTSGDYHNVISAYRPTHMYYLSFGGWEHNDWLVKMCSSDGCPGLHFGPTNPQTNVWYYLVCSIDGAKLRCFLDGIFENERDWNGGPINSGNQVIRIGAENSNYGEYLVGEIAELRISDVSRDSEWINSQYLNQNVPSDFYNIGPEESIP